MELPSWLLHFCLFFPITAVIATEDDRCIAMETSGINSLRLVFPVHMIDHIKILFVIRIKIFKSAGAVIWCWC